LRIVRIGRNRCRSAAAGASPAEVSEVMDRGTIARRLRRDLRSGPVRGPPRRNSGLPERSRLAFTSYPRLGLDQRYVLAKIVETYIELDEDEDQRFVAEIEQESDMSLGLAKLSAVTWEEALAESRAEGRIEGLQNATIVSARRRFGDVPSALEESIRTIHDPDRLYQALDRVLEADSVDEIDLDS
jgi:hypothetical protein